MLSWLHEKEKSKFYFSSVSKFKIILILPDKSDNGYYVKLSN